MRRVIYSMMVSLDGFVETVDHRIDWSVPDAELHQFFNDHESRLGAHLYGRRLYELMAQYWPTADQNPSAPPYVAQYARLWREMPKVVFSTTLEHVGWNSRLVRGDIAGEVGRLKEEPGKDLSVGGASLAAGLMRYGLIDEYMLAVHPVALGGGTPYWPEGFGPTRLRLVEARPFTSGVVLLRYHHP
ncbi:dihydrofolate reductase family protein [Streptomyces sodiiphilus]|uniref:Dihydrofolate reductase family protein n=1 Tax=Streptomyces sodiiphilus TaxID=226217 RepID=A0ABN2PH97_9ACTN